MTDDVYDTCVVNIICHGHSYNTLYFLFFQISQCFIEWQLLDLPIKPHFENSAAGVLLKNLQHTD